jgi:hypothetical protein
MGTESEAHGEGHVNGDIYLENMKTPVAGESCVILTLAGAVGSTNRLARYAQLFRQVV